jgi:acetylglutamate kinase
MLERLKIRSEFIGGLRVTDQATVEIVEMVLSGTINKAIVGAINAAGGLAIGLSGKDGNLISAEKLQRRQADPGSAIERVLDLGFVGQPRTINRHLLETLTRSDIIPVIAPIGVGPKGETYNINADTVAGAVAGAIGATRLLMMTDVAGVLDRSGVLIPDMKVSQVRALIADGTISGGMIPKVETCVAAVMGSAAAAVIIDGRIPHALLLEIFTDPGMGSAIWPD